MSALRHVSHRPRGIPSYRNVKVRHISPILIALLVALSSIYPLTWASEENSDHRPHHRRHHVPITKHRIYRSSPGKSTHPQERVILYKCNDSSPYRSDWENIMTQLDREQEMSESDRLTTTLTQEQFAESLHQITQKLESKAFQSSTSSAENSNKDGVALGLWSMAGDIGMTNTWHPRPKLLGVSELTDMDFRYGCIHKLLLYLSMK